MAEWYKWNTTNAPEPPTSAGQLQGLIGQMGLSGYMESRPELYDPSYVYWRDEAYGVPEDVGRKLGSLSRAFGAGCQALQTYKDQMKAYAELRNEFTGIESTYIRWLISNKIASIRSQYERQRQSNIETFHRMNEASVIARGGTEEEIAESRAWREDFEGGPISARTTPAPVPEWMRPYIEEGMAYERAPTGERRRTRSQKAETTTLAGLGQLRPLGAQAELDPEQLGQMAGYQSWGYAGFPTQYSERAIEEMADWQRWWTPYVKLSEGLFPKQTTLRKRWRVSEQ